MVLLYSFLLDSVEIKDYVLRDSKIEQTKNNQSGNTCTLFVADTVDDVKIPTVGQEVIISRGAVVATEKYEFRGEVKNIEVQENKYVITCKDKLNHLKYDIFTKSYDINTDPEAGELSAIFQDIVEDGGFSASVVSSGTGSSDITIEKFISRRQSRLNRLNVISKILNWLFYYDYDNEYIRLEPKGYTTFATPLVVGTNVYNIPRWNEDLENMRNNITVDGAYVEDTREKNEVGDDSTVTFDFDYEPEITECTVAGTLVSRGTVGSSESYDYTVDKENRTYTFVTAPTLGQAIVMKYTTRIPTPVSGKDFDSITQYNLEQAEAFEFKDLVTVEDAETRLQQLLDILKDAEISTNLITDEYNIVPGNRVTVTDPNKPSKNGEYIVQSVIINYPDPYDTIKIGTEKFDIGSLFQTIEERLNALETKDNGLIELLRQLISFFNNVTFENRYFLIEKRDISSTFVIGHPVYGAIGDYPIGAAGSWATQGIVQGNNTYTEFVVDEDFYDSAASAGVTWDDSSDNKITITDTLITSAITLGTTYSKYTLDFASITGDYTASISGDGKGNWQTVVEGTETTITDTDGTGVYIRIVANAGSVVLNNTYDDFDNFDEPSIKLKLVE